MEADLLSFLAIAVPAGLAWLLYWALLGQEYMRARQLWLTYLALHERRLAYTKRPEEQKDPRIMMLLVRAERSALAMLKNEGLPVDPPAESKPPPEPPPQPK